MDVAVMPVGVTAGAVAAAVGMAIGVAAAGAANSTSCALSVWFSRSPKTNTRSPWARPLVLVFKVHQDGTFMVTEPPVMADIPVEVPPTFRVAVLPLVCQISSLPSADLTANSCLPTATTLPRWKKRVAWCQDCVQ